MAIMVEAEGWLALPLQHLQQSLALSDRFQQITRTADSTEARKRAYIGAALDDGTQEPPRAILRYFDSQTAAEFGLNTFGLQGPIFLIFQFPIAPEHRDNFSNAYLQFLNDVGVILSEVNRLNTTAGCLGVTGVATGEIGKMPPEVMAEVMHGEFAISYKGMAL